MMFIAGLLLGFWAGTYFKRDIEGPAKSLERVGPFIHKKQKPKRKPISHDEAEDYLREQRNAGKSL
jgi:hypothetical protein